MSPYTHGLYRRPGGAHAGNQPDAHDIILGFPSYGRGIAALQSFAESLHAAFGFAVNYLDVKARYLVMNEVIRIGAIPPGLPRRLLHRYMFGYGSPLDLTPEEFLKDVGPVGSIYYPNSYNGNPNENREALASDVLQNFGVNLSSRAMFTGRYRFSCFHHAHTTAGLGRFAMIANVSVRGTSTKSWQLFGTALLDPEKWDFDYSTFALLEELQQHHPLDMTDLHGRERRTWLGAKIPGTPFLVRMTAPVHVQETMDHSGLRTVFTS